MKLSSLLKSQKKSSFFPLLCRLAHCGNPKTLSFRLENSHNIFNSQRFNKNVDDYMMKKVIEGLKIEKGRFFFEAREKNLSVLEVSSLRRSNNNNSGKGLEHLPFDGSCVIKLLDPVDSYGKKTSSILEGSSTLSKSNNSDSNNELENLSFDESCIIELLDLIDPCGKKASSILEGSSSALSRSNNNMLEYLPSNDSCVITLIDPMDPYEEKTNSILEGSSSTLSIDPCVITLSSSEDPYGNFMASMIKMIESNRENKDWEECIEEILGWYLEINEKHIHKYIIGAFCDLWLIHSSTPTTNIQKAFDNSPFSFNTRNPPSLHFLSLIETKAENITNTSSVISSVEELDR